MAIEKIEKPNGKWEIRATGKDVNELTGMLRESADLCNERNEAKNREYGMIEVETATGKRDVVREDYARRLQRKGYVPTRKSFVVPDMPWLHDKEKR